MLAGKVMPEEIKILIKKTADLARLEMPEKDADKYIDRAERVIEYFKILNELDTSKTEPTSHAVESACLLREDKVVTFDRSDEIMGQAPQVEKQFIKVPKVL